MRKAKGKQASVRIDPDNTKLLEKISAEDPIRPTLPQMVNALVRKYAHTLRDDNHPDNEH